MRTPPYSTGISAWVLVRSIPWRARIGDRVRWYELPEPEEAG